MLLKERLSEADATGKTSLVFLSTTDAIKFLATNSLHIVVRSKFGRFDGRDTYWNIASVMLSLPRCNKS